MGFKTVNAALHDGEFLFELLHQTLELVGHFGDAVEAGVQQCSRFKAGHCTVAAVGAVGVASDTAVALDQVAESLISPVSRINIRELGDAGDLLSSNRVRRHRGVVRNTSNIDFSRSSSHRSQKAQGSRSNKQLLEQFHGEGSSC